jgi:hypothetical protein
VRVAHEKRGEGVILQRIENDLTNALQELVVRFDSGEEHVYRSDSLLKLHVIVPRETEEDESPVWTRSTTGGASSATSTSTSGSAFLANSHLSA